MHLNTFLFALFAYTLTDIAVNILVSFLYNVLGTEVILNTIITFLTIISNMRLHLKKKHTAVFQTSFKR